MNVISNIIWAMLLCASVMAVALVLDAIALRLRLSRAYARESGIVARASALLVGGAGADVDTRSTIARSLTRFEHPVSQLYGWIFKTADPDLWERKVKVLLDDIDGGRLSKAEDLKNAAPVIGIGGSVIGVAAALYSYDGSASSEVMRGVATALLTTFAGVVVALVAQFASSSIMRPLLSRLESACDEVLNTAAQATAADKDASHSRTYPEKGAHYDEPAADVASKR
jgi:biopolymer transport protein ExbB/TolQ